MAMSPLLPECTLGVLPKNVTPLWQTLVMEAVRDFIACEEEGQGTDRGPAPVQQPGVDGVDGVDGALAALQALSATAVEDAGSWGFRAASDFAGRVEEFSRTVEYLQLVAASAVDRTRKQSAAGRGRGGCHLVDHGLAGEPGRLGDRRIRSRGACRHRRGRRVRRRRVRGGVRDGCRIRIGGRGGASCLCDG